MEGEKIFIIGGSGSLGNKLIEKHVASNQIICYSRDECKHWNMKIKYNNPNLEFIIGDIRDKERLELAIVRTKPSMIIIAAALKHIDLCEYATNECILTDLIGPQNILNIVENRANELDTLKVVCFVSTDKACSPVNVYGMCKALAESLVVEKSKYVKGIKFCCVRYGNVLNSRGSIIPLLHDKGKDSNYKEYTLTHPAMTRFVMTLDQSADLIQYAIEHAESGDIVIPKLISMRVKDLLEIFSEIYQKPLVISGLRPGEKMLESLINDTQSMRIQQRGDYIHIKPPYHNKIYNDQPRDYNSTINPLTKEELKTMLESYGLL